MLFTDFTCGLFGFDIEWQASNSCVQSTKGNRAILSFIRSGVHEYLDMHEFQT